MKFSIENDIRIAEVPVKDFRILLYDGKKKSMGKNRCTGGFFGNYNEGKDVFTLPVGHLVCDFAATSPHTTRYCAERGNLLGSRFWYDSGAWAYMNNLRGKRQSTLVVADGKANVQDLTNGPIMCSYAISGVPVLRDGTQVQMVTAKAQGWGGSSLYATYHIFVGLKERNASTIYVMGMRTRTYNFLATGEAARKFRALGLRDVIKLDGGGSYYFDAAGTTQATGENRRICTIIDMGGVAPDENPYSVPTKTLYRGCNNPTGVYWLQWELTAHGYPLTLDGSFGSKTEKQLKAYQAAHGLEPDGRCGPATRASLAK